MYKYIFILLTMVIFSITPLTGQKRLSRITFKDGTVVNGFAKFLDEGKEVEFFDEKKSDPIIYSYLNIEKVEMIKGAARTTYTYIQVINQGTIKLAELLASGKLNLYKFSYESEGWKTLYIGSTGNSISVSAPNGPITINNRSEIGFVDFYDKQTFMDFCVKRADEAMARYFKDKSTGASFKQLGSYYFQDCPDLSEKIKSGKLKLGKLPKIVDYYNNFCD